MKNSVLTITISMEYEFLKIDGKKYQQSQTTDSQPVVKQITVGEFKAVVPIEKNITPFHLIYPITDKVCHIPEMATAGLDVTWVDIDLLEVGEE